MDVGSWHGERYGRRCIAAALSLLLAACREPAPVTIGVVIGAEGERAALIALADANARRGEGPELRIRRFPQAFDAGAGIALAIADSLVDDQSVVAVVGHANSSASLAAAQVYNARGLPQVAPTSTTPLYSHAGPFSFRLVASDQHQARFLARALATDRAARVAIVYVNDDYGRALRGMLVGALGAAGVRPVFDAAYVERDPSNGPGELVRPLADSRPTVLAWIGRAPEFAAVASELRAALPRLPVLGSDGFGGALVELDTTGRFEDVRYVRLVDVTRADTVLQRVRAEYRRGPLGDLPDQAALTYDAVRLVAAAVREAGANRERVREWLAARGQGGPPFAGITGPIAFDQHGDRAPAYVLATTRAHGDQRTGRTP